MQTVFVKTLGCKVNAYDSHALENQLKAKGMVLSESNSGADITVINSCSVTANAEKEARYLARRYKRENPRTFVVITGCYAQTDSVALLNMAEVDYVVPNEVKSDAADLIADSFLAKTKGEIIRHPTAVKMVSQNKQSHFKSSLTLFDNAESSQTRVFLKVQDGCNGFCTYCLIPYARGASRSVPAPAVLQEVQRQVDLGAKEIVFTGIHIGDYGDDHSGADAQNFLQLLDQVLSVKGEWRLRISSLEPGELSEDVLKLMAARRDKVCAHFHLPLQSGCDRILKLMRRTYDSTEYANTVAMTRKYFPEANIGADVIPGFPSETEEEFQETYNFIESLNLSYLHVFPYSKRPNTAAFRMPGHLPPDVIKARSARLRSLSQSLLHSYLKPFVGQTAQVIWENDFDAEGRQRGHTAEYIKVLASQKLATVNKAIQKISLKGFVGTDALLASAVNAARM